MNLTVLSKFRTSYPEPASMSVHCEPTLTLVAGCAAGAMPPGQAGVAAATIHPDYSRPSSHGIPPRAEPRSLQRKC